ncbi:quinone oxidoreductase family protein [Agrobacterium salinitolerans]|uniref:quinone oxidoreductase family protein n=1 Tax=Agrobacterium salinitolerans TaxID=1183413 RepID=UPI00099016D1|nr:quinone oxidoreductase [Agrobacterium salinitolerans]NTA35796.1 quinone oxidoreductase [Agrobacterium salinitolerans]OOO22250.1 quinone oxidoreductase [Agrobacterium salinitolerans]PNQ23003.1 quinone oxidoreductase [Rhizobium sp. YIC5082]
MKAIRFHSTGGPDVLVYEDVPDPVAGPGEVLIKVEAVGMNFADIMRRRGDDYPEPSPPPFILGAEVAGTVAALGDGVTNIPVGLSVLAAPGAGGYAQYVVVPAATIIPLPEGFDAVQAAALLGHGLTAAIALKQAAKLLPGENVLIEGAAGGVGSFAIQLAKLYGAGKIIAAASTPEKRAKAEALGADVSVDYTKPDWADDVRRITDGQGVNIVIETAGGDTLNQALDAMAPFGRMIFLGQSSGKTALVDPWRLTSMNHSVVGFYIGAYLANADLLMATIGELIGFVASGQVKIQVGTVLPLSQAAEAHRLIEGRQTTGKVVLQPWRTA